MTMTAQQYRIFKDCFRSMLSVENVGPSEADVFAFCNQLFTDSAGAATLSAVRQFIANEVLRTVISSGTSNPTDANVPDFFTQLQTDSTGIAPMGQTTRYRQMRNALRSAMSGGGLNPSDADVLSYFGPYGSINFAALGAAFWIDASNPASYTATGTALTSIKSLVSGTALSTITGAPQIATDPRDGKPAFVLSNSSDYIMGTDAPFIAAANGTNKPYLSIAVLEPQTLGGSNVYVSAALSSDANVQVSSAFQVGGVASFRDGAGGFVSASSENAKSALQIIIQHSADGLTHKTQVNGGAETSVTTASAGAIACDRVGIGIAANSTPDFPWSGYLREYVFFGADQTPANIAAWTAALQRKWRAPPVIYAAGDSITVPAFAVNGGMYGLTVAAVRAAGGICDAQGPIASSVFPYRMSANSGDTPAQILTRIQSTTTGLGLGGGSQGYYSRTSLLLLMAGANMHTDAPTTLADYSALLNGADTLLAQGNPTARIAVTTITNQFTNQTYVTAFNAGLPAIWSAYNAAHPTRPLLIWDAYNALPNDGTTTYYADGTHPNDAGYVKLQTDPVYGLTQAVLPYLMSIQP